MPRHNSNKLKTEKLLFKERLLFVCIVKNCCLHDREVFKIRSSTFEDVVIFKSRRSRRSFRNSCLFSIQFRVQFAFSMIRSAGVLNWPRPNFVVHQPSSGNHLCGAPLQIPCCVFLDLSWDTNENPSTDIKLSRAIKKVLPWI